MNSHVFICILKLALSVSCLTLKLLLIDLISILLSRFKESEFEMFDTALGIMKQ